MKFCYLLFTYPRSNKNEYVFNCLLRSILYKYFLELIYVTKYVLNFLLQQKQLFLWFFLKKQSGNLCGHSKIRPYTWWYFIRALRRIIQRTLALGILTSLSFFPHETSWNIFMKDWPGPICYEWKQQQHQYFRVWKNHGHSLALKRLLEIIAF